MRIVSEISLRNFDAWSGGKETLMKLTPDECDHIESILEDGYSSGMTDTELNDFLWFERDSIAIWLGYNSWDGLIEDRG